MVSLTCNGLRWQGTRNAPGHRARLSMVYGTTMNRTTMLADPGARKEGREAAPASDL